MYTMSLIAIDVDSDREDRYLRELAHGLRLSPEICDQIKERLTGASAVRPFVRAVASFVVAKASFHCRCAASTWYLGLILDPVEADCRPPPAIP